jgi:hypothetical protein
MNRDVEFLRELLLELLSVQRSPPEPIFAPIQTYADRFQKPKEEIVSGLELLAELNFIEGPGAYRDGAWLFRRLTHRGAWLADAIKDPRDWRRVKDAYGGLLER